MCVDFAELQWDSCVWYYEKIGQVEAGNGWGSQQSILDKLSQYFRRHHLRGGQNNKYLLEVHGYEKMMMVCRLTPLFYFFNSIEIMCSSMNGAIKNMEFSSLVIKFLRKTADIFS